MFYAGIGSRETPTGVLAEMRGIAKELKELGYTLRSGGALGADTAFASADAKAQIYLPWAGYNKVRRSTLNEPTPPAIELAKTFHPAWHRCGEGAKKMHGRNMHILLGPNLDTPVDFVVCWTKDGRDTGGTGQAMRVAVTYGTPVFNLYHFDALPELRDFISRGNTL